MKKAAAAFNTEESRIRKSIMPAALKRYGEVSNMLRQAGNKVYRRFDKELLCIQPWGKNSFRVQATQLLIVK